MPNFKDIKSTKLTGNIGKNLSPFISTIKERDARPSSKYIKVTEAPELHKCIVHRQERREVCRVIPASLLPIAEEMLQIKPIAYGDNIPLRLSQCNATLNKLKKRLL